MTQHLSLPGLPLQRIGIHARLVVALAPVALWLAGCGGGGTTSAAPTTSIPKSQPTTTLAPVATTTATTSTTTTTPQFPKAFYLMCKLDKCEVHSKQKWTTSPKTLVDKVGDLSSVPGVPAGSWGPVVEQWKAKPPKFQGTPVTLADIAAFAKDLLSSDPFGTGDEVPYLAMEHGGEGEMVAVTQRQLAFVVVNHLLGNTIPVGNGLATMLSHCSANNHQTPFKSMLSMLAILSKELAGGKEGTMLIGATPRALKAGAWKERLAKGSLAEASVCNKVGGGKSGCPIEEFMSGGTDFQALTDIAGNDVGGGAQLCDTANSQDESLVQFYTEVLTFSFFTPKLLPVPWVLLGARRYLDDISGETFNGPPMFLHCGRVHDTDWLNSDIGIKTTVVPLGIGDGAVQVQVMASSFVAVKSECDAAGEGGCDHNHQINNNCDHQRRHVDKDVDFWYQAYEKSGYSVAVQAAFGGVVKRIGTGPWGSGVWWGDSQVYFLTMWLATNLLEDVGLDYYVYDGFCENPGNQCFVLGKDGCSDCVAKSKTNGIDSNRCGQRGVKDLVEQFKGQTPQKLYERLNSLGGPPTQAFDLLKEDIEIV